MDPPIEKVHKISLCKGEGFSYKGSEFFISSSKFEHMAFG